MRVSDHQRSLLQFDLSSIPPGATVTNGELVLCFSSILSLAAGRTHELDPATSSWTETGVNWNNQPGANFSSPVTWTVPLVTGCISVNVTAPLQAWVGGATNNGWRISDQNESGATLADVQYVTSEDGVAGLRPTLNVTYTPP